MRTLLAMLTAAALSSTAVVPSVYLKVVHSGSKSESRPNEDFRIFGSPGSFSKKTEREESFTVTVQNMSPIAFDYTVEWMFFAAPVAGGKAEAIHADQKKVSLGRGAAETFQIRTPKIESTHTHLAYVRSNDIFQGKKFAGYVVRVKIDDKILAVEASDATLKRQFQDPKAEWGVTTQEGNPPAAEPAPKKGKKKATP